MGSYANDHDLLTIIVAVLTRTFFLFVNMTQIESFEKRELQLRKCPIRLASFINH